MSNEEIVKLLEDEFSLLAEPKDISFKNLDYIGIKDKSYKLSDEAINQIYGFVGMPARFSRQFFDIAREDSHENTWRDAVDMFKKKTAGRIHFRINKDNKVLGVGQVLNQYYISDFKKPLYGVLQNFSVEKEFKFHKMYYNSITGTFILSNVYIDNSTGLPRNFTLDDSEKFTRLIVFQYNTNNITSGTIEDHLVRHLTDSICYMSERTARYPVKFESSEPIVDAAEAMTRVLSNQESFHEFTNRIKRIYEIKNTLSLAELEYFYNSLIGIKRVDPMDKTKSECLIKDLDDRLPLKYEVARQGFLINEYFSRNNPISNNVKSLAKTEVSIWDTWNFITNEATSNVDLDADQRLRLLNISAEFLGSRKTWDCETRERIQMPQFMFT